MDLQTLGTASKPAFRERSVLVGQYGTMRIFRYGGALLFKALYIRSNIVIFSILDLTAAGTGEM